MLPQDDFPQLLRRSLVQAVGDVHPSAGEARLLHLRMGGLQHPLFAAALVQRLQLALLGALAQHADAQHPRQLGDGRADPAVAGQVVQRLQAEQHVGVLPVGGDLLFDLLEGQLPLNQRAQLLHDQKHLRTRGQRVDHADLRVGVGLQKFLPGVHRRRVAAGQRAADGHGEDRVRALEGLHPLEGVRAGRARTALRVVQLLHHLRNIQARAIHVFPLLGDDLQGNADEIRILQRIQVGRGIRYDSILHANFISRYFV